MNRKIVNGRLKPGDLLLVMLGAFLLNLVVFGAASLLQREARALKAPLTYEIQAFLPEEPPPPPQQKKLKPPEKEKTPPKEFKRVKLAAIRKEKPILETPVLDLEVNPKLATGLDLGPVPPRKFGLADVDHAPMVTARVPPLYPYHAKRQGIQGGVTVRFLVDKKGRVSRISVIKAKPQNIFESSVLRSLARWRFRPGRKDGRPVDTWVETDILFELEKK